MGVCFGSAHAHDPLTQRVRGDGALEYCGASLAAPTLPVPRTRYVAARASSTGTRSTLIIQKLVIRKLICKICLIESQSSDKYS